MGQPLRLAQDDHEWPQVFRRQAYIRHLRSWRRQRGPVSGSSGGISDWLVPAENHTVRDGPHVSAEARDGADLRLSWIRAAGNGVTATGRCAGCQSGQRPVGYGHSAEPDATLASASLALPARPAAQSSGYRSASTGKVRPGLHSLDKPAGSRAHRGCTVRPVAHANVRFHCGSPGGGSGVGKPETSNGALTARQLHRVHLRCIRYGGFETSAYRVC